MSYETKTLTYQEKVTRLTARAQLTQLLLDHQRGKLTTEWTAEQIGAWVESEALASRNYMREHPAFKEP